MRAQRLDIHISHLRSMMVTCARCRGRHSGGLLNLRRRRFYAVTWRADPAGNSEGARSGAYVEQSLAGREIRVHT